MLLKKYGQNYVPKNFMERTLRGPVFDFLLTVRAISGNCSGQWQLVNLETAISVEGVDEESDCLCSYENKISVDSYYNFIECKQSGASDDIVKKGTSCYLHILRLSWRLCLHARNKV